MEGKKGVKYCSKCGSKLDDNLKCVRCHNTENGANYFAIVGLVLSLIPTFSIVGVAFSIIGLKMSKKLNGEGKGVSIAGLIIGVIISIIVIAWAFRGVMSFVHLVLAVN